MNYLISNVLSLETVPTNVLVLIMAIATCWAVLRKSKLAIWLTVTVACALTIGGVAPVGAWLMLPLEQRFPPWQTDADAAPDGIIVLGGESGERTSALAELSRRFPQAHLIYSGPGERISATEEVLVTFARLGGDPARITMETRSLNTFENALYSVELIKPSADERWLLVTSTMHMPRAVGSFRQVGFRVEAYPVEPSTGDGSHSLTTFTAGPEAFIALDKALREWTALVAYRFMGRTDALFPAP